MSATRLSKLGSSRPCSAAGERGTVLTPAQGERRRVLAGLACGLAGSLAACGTPVARVPPPSQPVPPPSARVGDRWRYGLTNLYNRLPLGVLTATVIEARPGTRVGLDTADGQPPAEEFYADPWRIVQDPNWDQPLVFDTPQPLLPADLNQPRTVTTASVYRTPLASGEFFWSQTLSTAGWERVSVPAGQFDCLRVLRRIAFRHSDPHRISSQRSDTIWYSPRVNRWVQRESSGSYIYSTMRNGAMREDWVLEQLLDFTSAPVS